MIDVVDVELVEVYGFRVDGIDLFLLFEEPNSLVILHPSFDVILSVSSNFCEVRDTEEARLVVYPDLKLSNINVVVHISIIQIFVLR